MNLVGKIFVVLILVMSLCFMGLAVAVYATHQNWERIVNLPPGEATLGQPAGLKFQLEDVKTKRAQLESQVTDLTTQIESERAAKRKALTSLQTAADEVRKERDRLANSNAEMVQREREAVAAMDATQKTLEVMRKEIDVLRTDIRAAQQERDDQFKQVVKLTDDLNQTQGELTRLKAETVTLTEQVTRNRQTATRLGIDLDVQPETVAPKLDGVVLASGKDGLVEISLGSDDGLQRGHMLDVYRGARYLGRIEVFQTSPDKSVAKILPQFRKGPIEKEDRVATRLN